MRELGGDAEPLVSDFADPVAVARAWVRGSAITVERRCLPGRPVSLPGHPFARRSCWFQPFPASADVPPSLSTSFRITIAAEDPEFIDHKVQGLRHLPRGRLSAAGCRACRHQRPSDDQRRLLAAAAHHR